MASRPTVELSRLREIGWTDWDPIGLAEMKNWPRDEYDSYLLQVVSRLRRGETVAEVAMYLYRVAAENMGLGKGASADLKAAETTVVHIQDYLATLQPGPPSVR